MFYLDVLKFIVAESYWSGLKIVPIVLWTYIFQGVYFNLSFWYKLTDRTQWGAWFSLIGVAITFTLQVVFVPKIGYMASALSSTVCYFVIMLLSYFVGRRYLVIPYDLKAIGGYTLLTLVLLGVYYAVRLLVPAHQMSISMAAGTVLLIIYLVVLVRKDFPLSGLPVVGKYFSR